MANTGRFLENTTDFRNILQQNKTKNITNSQNPTKNQYEIASLLKQKRPLLNTPSLLFIKRSAGRAQQMNEYTLLINIRENCFF